MKKYAILFSLLSAFLSLSAQNNWMNLDAAYQPLPSTIHIYKSIDSVDGKPNVMYYAIADLKDKNLLFTSDTTQNRRLTPSQFYDKNDHPILVVNTSFFSFATNQNLNVVVKDGEIVSYNEHSISLKGKDTLTYNHPFFSAIGITKRRNADVAWIYSDSSKRYLYASQNAIPSYSDSAKDINWKKLNKKTKTDSRFSKWKVTTAVGGGPVLVQNNEVKITNNEERKFAGKAVNNLEPRTAIGYTKDNHIVVFVCEGRSTIAAGLSLLQMAKILKDIGCKEALNLDGGGSSCMLINGKETNTPSSKGVQRQVPSVFLIKSE